MKIYKASEVAEWFLARNNIDFLEGSADMITNLKLQKLLYYAQGCTLALTNYPLFKEDILAWTHGPVVREVYDIYKRYGAEGITFYGYYKNVFDDDHEDILEQVYQTFGIYSAWGLRNMTHNEAPWKNTQINCVINKELIKSYFLENYCG